MLVSSLFMGTLAAAALVQRDSEYARPAVGSGAFSTVVEYKNNHCTGEVSGSHSSNEVIINKLDGWTRSLKFDWQGVWQLYPDSDGSRCKGEPIVAKTIKVDKPNFCFAVGADLGVKCVTRLGDLPQSHK